MPETPLKVLLVEDVSFDARIVSTALATAESRYRLTWVARLAGAVEKLATEEFDVILSDLTLPDGGPPESIHTVRNAAGSTPIIVLTSLEQRDMALAFLDGGVQDYLLKDDVTPDGLDRSIRYAIQRQHGHSEVEQLLGQVQQSRQLLKRKNRRLAKLCKTAQRFVDNVSHEFRTPLTVIKEYADLVRQGFVGEVCEEQCRFLDVVADRADDLNRMVDDMLDVSRLESGLLATWRKNCRVIEFVDHVRPSLAKKAELKNVSLRIDIPDGLPTVFCDAEKAGRVLVNLAVNAIKFSGEPGWVHISAGTDPVDGGVVISVRDNGPGVDEASREKIFERFRQLKNTVRGSSKGFGLGLSIAQELVELNFGRMDLESSPGDGSAFSFTLPPGDAAVVVRRYLERTRRRRSESSPVSLVGLEIEPATEPELADEVDDFLNCLLRCSDLLYRTGGHSWLLLVPEPQSELSDLHRRYEGQLEDGNHNRPGAALPQVAFNALGTWPVGTATPPILRAVRSLLQDAAALVDTASGAN
jgi:hypothetical protein